jgi:lysylphosphatidylglycerol synthetase-like protein (DUF2156 family)
MVKTPMRTETKRGRKGRSRPVVLGKINLLLALLGLSPSILVPFIISTIALSVILTWVYNSTGGSLLLVVLLHATANFPLTLLLEPLGSRAVLPFWLFVGLMVVAAIVVVMVAGPKHLSRKHRKQEEQGAAQPAVAAPPGVVKPTPA